MLHNSIIRGDVVPDQRFGDQLAFESLNVNC